MNIINKSSVFIFIGVFFFFFATISNANPVIFIRLIMNIGNVDTEFKQMIHEETMTIAQMR